MNSYRRIVSHSTSLYELFMNIHLDQISKVVRIKEDDYVLEVGCDQGVFVRKLRAGYGDIPGCEHMYGTDINESAILRGSENGIPNLLVASANCLPFKDGQFDFLLSMHTIEHLEDLRAAYAEFSRVLKDDGRMVLIYPWEPIKGITCFPFLSRHKHRLNPAKLESMVGQRSETSYMYWAPQPTYLSVFKKTGM